LKAQTKRSQRAERVNKKIFFNVQTVPEKGRRRRRSSPFVWKGKRLKFTKDFHVNKTFVFLFFHPSSISSEINNKKKT
jgi:hypothetical protein